jgi:hypothetical protein
MGISRYRSILLIDNDVLVNLSLLIEAGRKDSFMKVISFLAITYTAIWIPATVRYEFLIKRRDKKRNRVLKWIMKEFSIVTLCPIKVSKKEIEILVGSNDENVGEADAIIQCQKAKSSDSFAFSDIVFFSNDKKALTRAEGFDISLLRYSTFRERMLEAGIEIPI